METQHPPEKTKRNIDKPKNLKRQEQKPNARIKKYKKKIQTKQNE